MKIAIEAQRIFRTNKHGMDFVALESIRELQKIDKENEYFIFVSPGEDHCLEETSNTHIVEVKCPTYPLWEQVALPRAVAKIRPDLLHCTSNTAPIHCPVPLVLTLHDIIFLEPKQGGNTSWYQNMGWHYRRLVVPRILPKCKRIITVSHFERDRIREALCLPKEQIMAIYNGYSQHFHPLSGISAITHKYIHSDDYLFFLLRTMVFIAINNEWLTRDPFREYEIKKEETTRSFLTKEEIRLLMDGKLKNAKQELYRDLYLFCAFTGLSFSDMRSLTEENIRTYFDEHEWININRQKTGVVSNIRLLDIANRIIGKYRGLCENGKIFPVPHYNTCLAGIRAVAKRCGITKHITWHQSRHTAATTVFLSNGVPIETVSSMLGHKSIKTTQIYAKITKEKLNQDMKNLAARLNSVEEFAGCTI